MRNGEEFFMRENSSNCWENKWKRNKTKGLKIVKELLEIEGKSRRLQNIEDRSGMFSNS
jgi:hypothetical protein